LGNFPDLSLNINGFFLKMKPIDYIINRDGVCRLGIIGNDLKNDTIIMGNIFNVGYYMIFDVQNKRIGFGQLLE